MARAHREIKLNAWFIHTYIWIYYITPMMLIHSLRRLLWKERKKAFSCLKYWNDIARATRSLWTLNAIGPYTPYQRPHTHYIYVRWKANNCIYAKLIWNSNRFMFFLANFYWISKEINHPHSKDNKKEEKKLELKCFHSQTLRCLNDA